MKKNSFCLLVLLGCVGVVRGQYILTTADAALLVSSDLNLLPNKTIQVGGVLLR